MPESPIFVKAYDMLLWVSEHVSRFPKSERFRLAKRIEDHAFAFYEALVHAAKHRQSVEESLNTADETLYRLKVYFRLAKDRGFTSQRQYHFAAEKLVELGRLLGGWKKTVG